MFKIIGFNPELAPCLSLAFPRSVCGGRKETATAGDGPRTEEKSFRGPRTVGGEEDQLSRAATTEANARGNYCTIRQERRERATPKRHLDTCSNLTPTNQKEKERKREFQLGRLKFVRRRLIGKRKRRKKEIEIFIAGDPDSHPEEEEPPRRHPDY